MIIGHRRFQPIRRDLPVREALGYAEQEGDSLFAGASMGLSELCAVFVNDQMRQAFRPAQPLSYNFEEHRMVPHDERAVVCASTLARVAIFKALFHPDHHMHIKRVERRCGWAPGPNPLCFATTAIIKSVKEQGDDLHAKVARFAKAPPFYQSPPYQPHQYRSEAAVVPFEMLEVKGGRDFIEEEIGIVEPYPDIHVTDASGNALEGCICSGCAV